MLATDIASVLSAARDSRDTARAQAQLSLAQVEAGEDGVDAADAAIAAAQRAFDAYARLERARSAEARHAKSAWLEGGAGRMRLRRRLLRSSRTSPPTTQTAGTTRGASATKPTETASNRGGPSWGAVDIRRSSTTR